MQATLEGQQSAERSSDHGNQDRLGLPAGAPLQVPRRSKPGHLASHTSAVSLGFGTLTAVLLLVLPGTVVARAARLTWPIAVAVGPALTYGVVGLAIIPYGALGIPWNALDGAAGAGRGERRRGEFAGGVRPLPRHGRRSADGVARTGPDGCRRRPARRPAHLVRRLPRDAALAVHPEHLGRRVARQRDPLDPRHRLRRRRPTWASCATSKPTCSCTTRRCSTRWARCSLSSPAPRPRRRTP